MQIETSRTVPIPPFLRQRGEGIYLLLIIGLGTSWDEWSASRFGRAVHPRMAGWASELVWIERLEKQSFASAGDRTPVIQSVVGHYTDRVTPAPVGLHGS
jgi:hypothetical protein